MRYELTEEAHGDLAKIAVYTFERWGAAQELNYIGALFARFDRIASDSAQGTACDGLQRGLRRARQGSHVVYFRVVAGEVEIVRVLHKSQLPERHIDPS